MDRSRIDAYKANLEKERVELLAAIKKQETPESFGSDIDHLEEKSDEVEETVNQLAEVRVFKDRINEIDSALIKIAHDAYGKCEKCGNDIEEKKLDLDSASRVCIKCAS